MGMLNGMIPDEVKDMLSSSQKNMEEFSKGINRIATLLEEQNKLLKEMNRKLA